MADRKIWSFLGVVLTQSCWMEDMEVVCDYSNLQLNSKVLPCYAPKVGHLPKQDDSLPLV